MLIAMHDPSPSEEKNGTTKQQAMHLVPNQTPFEMDLDSGMSTMVKKLGTAWKNIKRKTTKRGMVSQFVFGPTEYRQHRASSSNQSKSAPDHQAQTRRMIQTDGHVRTGADATAGTAANRGAKKRETKKRAPPTTAVSPVRPPSKMPAVPTSPHTSHHQSPITNHQSKHQSEHQSNQQSTINTIIVVIMTRKPSTAQMIGEQPVSAAKIDPRAAATNTH